MANVLLVRSEWPGDVATKYLASYGSRIRDQAQQWGHSVTELYADLATTENFEKAIPDADILIGLSHGNSDRFAGQAFDLNNNKVIDAGDDIQILLKDNVNADVMSGKQCFLGSCLTALKLGPAMVKQSCPAFFGFSADLIFIYHPDYYVQDKVLEDPWAQPFFDCINTTANAVLLQKTPKEIYDETIKRYNYWWDYWLKQNNIIGDDILTCLHHNREYFTAITPTESFVEPHSSLSLGNLVVPAGIVSLAALFLLLARNR